MPDYRPPLPVARAIGSTDAAAVVAEPIRQNDMDRLFMSELASIQSTPPSYTFFPPPTRQQLIQDRVDAFFGSYGIADDERTDYLQMMISVAADKSDVDMLNAACDLGFSPHLRTNFTHQQMTNNSSDQAATPGVQLLETFSIEYNTVSPLFLAVTAKKPNMVRLILTKFYQDHRDELLQEQAFLENFCKNEDDRETEDCFRLIRAESEPTPDSCCTIS